MSNFGDLISSLPTINFCRLPPERDLASILLEGVCTSKLLITFSVKLETIFQSITPRLVIASEFGRLNSMFSSSDISGTAPCPNLSSGTKNIES